MKQQSCSDCSKTSIKNCVPLSWHPDDPDKRMCASCFGFADPEAKILTFDTPRGGLWSRWTAQGFGDHVMMSAKEDKLFVLAAALDEHHRQMIVQDNLEEPRVIPAGLLQEYRVSGAIYEMDVVQFWKEMWWWFFY